MPTTISIAPDQRPAVKVFKGKTLSANRTVETVTYANGDKYEGLMRDGKKHGHGKFTWANGDVYTGDYIDDLKTGFGRLAYCNGDVYEGCRVRDRKEGKGKYSFENGCIYDGNYVDDEFHGIGMFKSNEGWTYEGKWDKNEAKGQGKLRYANGDVYVGGFKEDMRDGVGCIVFADGSKYEGAFVKDEKNGHGKMTHADGRIDEGEFEGDVFVRPTIMAVVDQPTAKKPPAMKKPNKPVKKKPPQKKAAPLKKRLVPKVVEPEPIPLTASEIRKKVATSCVEKVLLSQLGSTSQAIFLLSRSVVDQHIKAAIQLIAPTPTVIEYVEIIDDELDIDEDYEEVDDIVDEPKDQERREEEEKKEVEPAEKQNEEGEEKDVHESIEQKEERKDEVDTTEEKVEEGVEEGKIDSAPTSQQYPPPPSESSRFAKRNRPVQKAKLSKSETPVAPITVDVAPDMPESSGDQAMDTEIRDLIFLLKDLGEQDGRDSYDSLDATLTDEQRAAKHFPKSKKHYDDIRLGKAMTELLSDKSKLQKYLKPESDYLPPSNSTMELIQRIRRELNLPGNKGPDPQAQSIASDLEKELVDEDIAYVDEMAVDYSSFIMVNKEASATWSSVEIPRLGSSIFKNLTNESSMLKNDPLAELPLVQSAVSAAGVNSPVKNDWMDIFDGAPPTTKMRREAKKRREVALNKKSPYYATAQLAGKSSTSKSSETFLKVGNPCSAANMRSRKLHSSEGGALITALSPMMTPLPLPSRSNGTPTLQSTMKVKSGSKDAASFTFELLVPKTQNGLQIQFAQSSAAKIRKSLVVKALSSDSNVAKQGILKLNDEILEVNSVPVKGKFVDDIMGIIAKDTDSFILVLVKRSKINSQKSSKDEEDTSKTLS